MKKDAKILFFYPSENEQARLFVSSLKSGLPAWNIKLQPITLTTLLFDIRSADLAHFFLPATTLSAQVVKKLKGKRPVLQTLLTAPEKAAQYKQILFGDEIVVFTENQRVEIQSTTGRSNVTVVPPCVALPDTTSLPSAQEVRHHFKVEDNLLVLALNDFVDKADFKTHLYIAREYHRREGFRFLVPSFRKGKASDTWRSILQTSLEQEKLHSTTLLDNSADLHALIDAADFTLYVERDIPKDFAFSLQVLEALLLGKPVICSKTAPVRETIAEFDPEWIANDAEDFVRISRDLLKQSRNLEQISTDLARFARRRFSVTAAAELYQEIYQRLLHSEVA